MRFSVHRLEWPVFLFHDGKASDVFDAALMKLSSTFLP